MTKENRVSSGVIAVVVTDRDREIMRFIGEGGIANLDQIVTRYWDGRVEAKKTARLRLAKLEKAGWIGSGFIDVRKPGELVFFLSRQGALHHFSRIERARLIVGLPAWTELKQQLLLQDARLVMEQELNRKGHKLVGWFNEHQLRSEARRGRSPGSRAWYNLAGIADARALIEDSEGSSYEVEIEADGYYWGKNLAGKLGGLAQSAKSVIWVTTRSRQALVEKRLAEERLANPAAENITLLVLD